MKTLIYYFSGTGNSLQVARDLARRLDGASICAVTKDTEADLSAETVGVVFPVYLWGAPDMVLQFLEKLGAKSAGRYYFAIATYKLDAGDAIGQVKRKLDSCGVKLSAGFSIAMPGNYIILYDTEPPQEQNRKLEAGKHRIDEIAKAVSLKQEIVPASSALDRILKTGLLRPALTRTFRNADKRFWVKQDCSGCGTCARVCPAGNIKLDEGRPVWLHRCQQCMGCINLCPEAAIQSGNITLKRGRYRNPAIEISELLIHPVNKG